MNRGAIDLPRRSYQTHLKMTADFSEVLIDVWHQALVDKSETVRLGAESFRVTQSKAKRLRQIEFVFEGKTIIGIQQNPNTKSKWAEQARAGKKVSSSFRMGGMSRLLQRGKLLCTGSELRVTNHFLQSAYGRRG
jgi:hypothetical protein